MLEINGLNVFYGDYQALFDIKATVESGEIVSLLGANGAGKTTSVKMLLGLIRPTAGSATWRPHGWGRGRRGLVDGRRAGARRRVPVRGLRLGLHLHGPRRGRRDRERLGLRRDHDHLPLTGC